MEANVNKKRMETEQAEKDYHRKHDYGSGEK
jgi:hypothetical protein